MLITIIDLSYSSNRLGSSSSTEWFCLVILSVAKDLTSWNTRSFATLRMTNLSVDEKRSHACELNLALTISA